MKTRASIASSPLIKVGRYPALGAIAIYRQAISPIIQALFGRACRFEPSCSEYAAGAIREYGLIRGGGMTAWRILRCNPLGGHGFDPVPKMDPDRATSVSIAIHQIMKPGLGN